MTTPPTEDEARSLLARAAATIDVDETAPMTLTGLPEPRPRRWPMLAAAAGVVLAIGGGFLVAQQLGDEPQPAPTVDETDTADREPVEREHVYAGDEMPSLLGYTEEEATELIHARGNPLRVEAEYSCELPKGYVIGTDPGPGSPLAPDDEVEIRVIAGILPSARCFPAGQGVWDLVRFARGLGPAPVFPDGVSTAVGDGELVALTAEETADPESWVLCDDSACHSAIAALEQILTRPVRINDQFAHTFLVVADQLPCLWAADQPRLPATSRYVYVDYPVDGIFCPDPPVLEIEWSKERSITSVRVWVDDGETPDAEPTEPTEPTAERKEAAEAFVAWARGEGPPPEFATQVRRLTSGREWWRPLITRPDDPARWDTPCPRFMSAPCPRSAVDVLRDYQGRVAQSSTLASGCGRRPNQLPSELRAAAAADLVRLDQPEAKGCADSWSVELWIDDEGRLYAVNTRAPLF